MGRFLFILLLISPFAHARDIVLYISNGQAAYDLYPDDVVRTNVARSIFAGEMRELDPDVKVIIAPASFVEQIPDVVARAVKEGDVIRGVVIDGHSSPRNFWLSGYSPTPPDRLGQVMGEALKNRQLARNFLVTLSGCHTGRGRDPFHERFLDAFAPAVEGKVERIEVTGHLYQSNARRWHPVSDRDERLRLTGIPHLIESLGDVAFRGATRSRGYHAIVRKVGGWLSFMAAGKAMARSLAIASTRVSVLRREGGVTSERRTSLHDVWAKHVSCGEGFARVR